MVEGAVENQVSYPTKKDGSSSHDLSERDWEKLPEALQNPFAISKLDFLR